MKRIVKYRIFNIILILAYIILILVGRFLNFKFNDYFWIILFFLFMGISLILKSIIFNSDSSLWLGTTLFLTAITIYLMLYFDINFVEYCANFLISPIIASLFNGLIFKDALQLKVMFYLFGIIIPLYLLNFEIINVTICVLIIISLILILIFIFNFISIINFKLKNKK